MRYRNSVLLLLLMIVLWALAACNLSATSQSAPTPTTEATGQPVVTIISPQTGSEAIVGTQVLISANATDSVGVTRVQLLANNQVVKTVSSETAGGDRNLNVLLDYTPQTEGQIVLQVIAFRGNTASAPAAVTINARRQNQPTATGTSRPQVTTGPIINPNDPTCRIFTNTAVNLRFGPGTVYEPRLAVLAAGTVAPITGRTGDNSWWQVRVGTTTGWVSGQYVSIYGNCSSVIIPPIPPTPTPIVTATLTATSPGATAQPTHTPTQGLPDLVISNIDGPTALTIAEGETSVTANFAVTITNTGAGGTAQFDNSVTVSPGAEHPLGVVANLAAGQSILLDISLTFDAAGTYIIQARADVNSQITEQSEVNNIGIATVTVTGPMAFAPGVNAVNSLMLVTIDPALLPTISAPGT